MYNIGVMTRINNFYSNLYTRDDGGGDRPLKEMGPYQCGLLLFENHSYSGSVYKYSLDNFNKTPNTIPLILHPYFTYTTYTLYLYYIYLHAKL